MPNKNLLLILLISVCLFIPGIAFADNYSNIMFLHHSTGSGLIAGGNVRALINAYNTQHGTTLEFWDHGYNAYGVRDHQLNAYSSYNIIYDNTDPDGFYALFNQPINNPPDNAFSYFMLPHQMGARTITHEVFIFKSCYPASNISSETMLNQYKTWYLAIRDVMDAHPEKIFIPLSPPPLVRSSTTPENAARARRFATWLASSEYLAGHPNVFVYNFWNDLAEHDSTSIYYNCLRVAFGGDGGDSHPNDLGNQTCGPLFVACITNAIETYGNSNPAPSVTLSAPNGGEIWQIGSNYTIAWADTDNQAVTAYKLEYSTDAGLSWLSIQDWTSGDPHTLNWMIPFPATEQARIRISCRDSIGEVGTDISDSNFTIVGQAPSVTLTTPNGGEIWQIGSIYTIAWADTDNQAVTAYKLDYSTDAGLSWLPIQDWTTGDPHTFNWMIPFPATEQARVRISCRDSIGEVGTDTSDSNFTIVGQAPSVTLTAPNGGEIWQAGSTYSIAWADTDNQAVTAYKLEYSINDGSSWQIIQDCTNGDPHTYGWLVPLQVTTEALIRVSCRDSLGESDSDVSDSNFTIADQAPTVTLTSPVGGESLSRGETHQITWFASDNFGITAHKLEYSTNAGADWTMLQDWTSGDPHNYEWVVLAPPSDVAYIRIGVRDTSGGTAYDISDSSFTIYDIAVPCYYLQGDLNGDSQRMAADVTFGVRYFKGIGTQPNDSCYLDSTGSWLYAGGDVNGNCEFRGSDITRLVAFFKGSAALEFCHFFPPPPLRAKRD